MHIPVLFLMVNYDAGDGMIMLRSGELVLFICIIALLFTSYTYPRIRTSQSSVSAPYFTIESLIVLCHSLGPVTLKASLSRATCLTPKASNFLLSLLEVFEPG